MRRIGALGGCFTLPQHFAPENRQNYQMGKDRLPNISFFLRGVISVSFGGKDNWRFRFSDLSISRGISDV